MYFNFHTLYSRNVRRVENIYLSYYLIKSGINTIYRIINGYDHFMLHIYI
jgi:hypothetical protein